MRHPASLDLCAVRPLVETAVREDLGGPDLAGDLTSAALIPGDAVAEAVFVAKDALVVAGLAVAAEVARFCDSTLVFSARVSDGDSLPAGAVLARLEGGARSILAAERTSLNFLQRLSGIASATRRYVDAVAGTRAAIVDTRKTVPGHRILDKYAVACGGGRNHRTGLFDGVLIKNNHLEFRPDPEAAVRAVRQRYPGGEFEVEVEVRSMGELASALRADPDFILLDNFTPDQTREAVALVAGRVRLESSGGITIENVREYALAGVDRISVGALTHSVAASDIHLRVSPLP